MTTKSRRERREFETLRKLGFEFRPPVDEYSYQPDSSGTIGGVRGQQEYGIVGGVSSEGQSGHLPPESDLLDARSADSYDAASSGISEFTGHLSVGEEDMSEELEESKRPSYLFDVEPHELEELIKERLHRHDSIDAHTIGVAVSTGGLVTLVGTVQSDALKLRVEEVVSAIPGVVTIDNGLAVTHH